MINISEILRDCPAGIKLYSPVFGECTFNKVLEDDGTIQVYINDGKLFDGYFGFNKYGHLHFDGGECLLFPSKYNRDWEKFSIPTTFHQGDILYYKDADIAVVYDKGYDATSFEGKDYFSFKEKYYLEGMLCVYDNYVKADKATIERYKKAITKKLSRDFKPFDKVVARFAGGTWSADLFSHYDDENDDYVTIGGVQYDQCFPYNEETVKLIGTHNDYECSKLL